MSTHENITTEKPDVCRKVTDAIVNAIESGSGQYRMPSPGPFRSGALGGVFGFSGLSTH